MCRYRCLFCGEEVTDQNVLFVDEGTSMYYQDTKRYDFLMQCSTSYPLEHMDQFRDVYFYPSQANHVRLHDDGFPFAVEVKKSEGLSPEELLANPGATAPATQANTKTPLHTEGFSVLYKRACPHCHCKLPEHFGEWPVVTVSLMGGRAAGKTAYIISLLQQLNRQLPVHGLGAAKLLPESQTYMNPQIDFFQENQGNTIPTSHEHLFPLVFEYCNGYGHKDYACYIVLYDIAGEGVDNINYLANHKGIREASIILLMIDPNQINGGGYYTARHEPVAQTQAEQHEYYAEQVGTFLLQRLAACGQIVQHLRYVVTVLTKLDYPLTVDAQLFEPPGNVLLRHDIEDNHQKAVNTAVLDQLDSELSAYFRNKLHNVDIKQLIRRQFDLDQLGVYLLGVSTYTLKRYDEHSEPAFDNDWNCTASKHRIIEPFLAILVLSGMVDTVNLPSGNMASASQATLPRASRWRRRKPLFRRA
ncbi:MAG: hypothetical protein LLF96_07580 [Eubacteriales bacterium]|nr:hypothetical protein [Eubacteriales bacterium]